MDDERFHGKLDSELESKATNAENAAAIFLPRSPSISLSLYLSLDLFLFMVRFLSLSRQKEKKLGKNFSQ